MRGYCIFRECPGNIAVISYQESCDIGRREFNFRVININAAAFENLNGGGYFINTNGGGSVLTNDYKKKV
ncbi:MAG: hypothetical protein ACJAQ2_002069 [Vicingaceae bacterium]